MFQWRFCSNVNFYRFTTKFSFSVDILYVHPSTHRFTDRVYCFLTCPRLAYSYPILIIYVKQQWFNQINIGIKSETRLLHLCKIVFVTFMVCINNWVILTSSNNYKHILHYRRNVESQTDIIWLIFPVGTVPNSNRTIIERGKFDPNTQIHDTSNTQIHDTSNTQIHDASNTRIHDTSNTQIHDTSNTQIHDTSNIQIHDTSNTQIHDTSNTQIHDHSRHWISTATSRKEIIINICIFNGTFLLVFVYY